MKDSALIIRTNTLPDGMFAKVEGFNKSFEFNLTPDCILDINKSGGTINDGDPLTFACCVVQDSDYIRLVQHFVLQINEHEWIWGLERPITDDVLQYIINVIFDDYGVPEDKIDDKYLKMILSQLHDFFEDIHARYPNSKLMLSRIS